MIWTLSALSWITGAVTGAVLGWTIRHLSVRSLVRDYVRRELARAGSRERHPSNRQRRGEAEISLTEIPPRRSFTEDRR